MTTTYKLPISVGLAVFIGVGILGINEATAATLSSSFTVTNNTGQAIDDYHAAISNTGGTISNMKLSLPAQGEIDSGQKNPSLLDPKNNPFGLPTDIVIKFTTPIQDKGKFTFTFEHTDYGATKIEGQVFTVQGKPIPEASSALGILTLGVMGTYSLIKRTQNKQKLASSPTSNI